MTVAQQGPEPGDRGARTIGSALKCLALLDELAGAGPSTVSELARRTEGRRGTVFQQLRTLIAAGWVEQTEDRRYRLTLHALFVGTSVLEQADLGSRVLPTLAILAARTGETASLAALDHGAATIVQRVAADRALRADIKPGTRMPISTSASGRVLAAFAREDEIAQAVSAGGKLPPADLVRQTRERGYATQHDEYLGGMTAISVPVPATKLGTVALAVTAPSSRYDEHAIYPHMLMAKTEIAQLLGGS